jgi:hypothetical protein
MIMESKSSRNKKENYIPQLRRRFHLSTKFAILLACCVMSLIGLIVVGNLVSRLDSPRVNLTPTEAIPTLTQAIYTSTPPIPVVVDTLTILENNTVPAGDWRDEAIRLKGILDIPEVVSMTPANYCLATRRTFISPMQTPGNRENSRHS